MKKKMCDHPAGVLFAVVATFLIAFLNYSAGNMKTVLILSAVIIILYGVICWLCKKNEDSENEEDK